MHNILPLGFLSTPAAAATATKQIKNIRHSTGAPRYTFFHRLFAILQPQVLKPERTYTRDQRTSSYIFLFSGSRRTSYASLISLNFSGFPPGHGISQCDAGDESASPLSG